MRRNHDGWDCVYHHPVSICLGLLIVVAAGYAVVKISKMENHNKFVVGCLIYVTAIALAFQIAIIAGLPVS